MGLFSFLRGAGRKHSAEQEADLAIAIKESVNGAGLAITGFGVRVDGETALVRGTAASQADREKAILMVGNTEGIGQVDDRMEVAKPAAQKAPPTPSIGDKGAPPSPAKAVSKAAAKSAPAPQSRFYTVQKGDNLSAISKRHYGSPNHWKAVFEANQPMLENPNLIYVGQVLRIPEL